MDVGDREGFDEFISFVQYFDYLGVHAPFRVAPKGTENKVILGLLVKVTGQAYIRSRKVHVRGTGGP